MTLGSREDARQLQTELAALTGEQPLIVERRGIDGATAVILVVMVTIKKRLDILNAIERLLTRNSVKEIEITGHSVRIVNPQPQDLDRLRPRLEDTTEGRRSR